MAQGPIRGTMGLIVTCVLLALLIDSWCNEEVECERQTHNENGWIQSSTWHESNLKLQISLKASKYFQTFVFSF